MACTFKTTLQDQFSRPILALIEMWTSVQNCAETNLLYSKSFR